MFSLPPLGICLARTLGENLTDKAVRQCADAMVKLGLRDAGYEYLIIGDEWTKPQRCLKTDSLVCDSEKFPEGLSATADYVHSLGLKIGVVTTLGGRSTTGHPGIFDHEWQDTEYLANAGVDYIACDVAKLPARAELQTPLRRMGMAIRQAERDIYYALYTDTDVHMWIRSTGVNSYCLRSFGAAAPARECKPESAGYSADFCFESCGDIVPDSTDSLRAQLICASAMSSPIIVDCDVRSLDAECLSIMKNPEIVGVCRDEEARPARRLSDGVYTKMLAKGEYAVAFMNNTNEPCRRSFYTYDFGLTWNAGYYCEACDIFSGEKTEFSDGLEAELAPGGAAMYRIKLLER